MLTGVVLSVSLTVPAVADGAPVPLTPVRALANAPQSEERIDAADGAVEAQTVARAQGARVEVLSERSETSLTFAEPDGSWTTEMSTGVERVNDGSGEDGWRNIDLTLQTIDGVVRPASPLHDLTLNGGSDDRPLVELRADEESIGFGWDGPTLPEPILDGPRALYEEVEPNVDLVVEATRYGFEHYLVLKERPADTSDSAITLPVVSDGLSLAADEEGVVVVNDDEVQVGRVGTAFMWGADANLGGGPANTSLPVDAESLAVADVSLDGSGGSQTLVVDPGEEFLEQAAYPVVIDPSVTFGNPADTYVTTAYPNNSYPSATELMFGTYNSGAEKYRAYLKFSGQPIAGAQVLSASLKLYGHKSYNCNASDFTVRPAHEGLASADITWNNQPVVNMSVAATVSAGGRGGGSACPAGWLTSANVKSLVQNAADQNKTTFSMRLSASETSNLQWRRISSSNGAYPPKLVVNFNRPPAAPSAPTISGSSGSGVNRTVSTLRPSFSSTATDPDGGTLNYTFEVYKSATISAANLVTTCEVSAASGKSASCMTPASKLANNTSYWVRAVVTDGVSGSSPVAGPSVQFKPVIVAEPPADVIPTEGGGYFTPLTGRILDTRNGNGGYTTPMAANSWRTFNVAGQSDIPDDGSVTAVAVTIIAVQSAAEGTIRGRSETGAASTILGRYGSTSLSTTSVPAVLPVSPDGTIDLHTSSATHLVIDVRGYYGVDDLPTSYVPVTGTRIADTRSGLGAPQAALAPSDQVEIQVAGDGFDVPEDAHAVLLSITTANATGAGHLTAFATGDTSSGSLHYSDGINTTLQTPVEVGTGGTITVKNAGTTTTDFVVDVFGYFMPNDEGESVMYETASGRIYDSRAAGLSKFSADETRRIDLAGTLGIPPAGSGITAITLTITSPGGEGGATRAVIWPENESYATTTALSLGAGTLRSNTVTVGLGAGGAVNLRNIGKPADYIIDVQGWYLATGDVAVACAEDLTADETPGLQESVDPECSEVEDAEGPEATFVDENGGAFWVAESEETEVLGGTQILLEEEEADESPSALSTTSSEAGDAALEDLASEAGFCVPEIGAELVSALEACAADPQPAPDVEEPENPSDDEPMAVAAATAFDKCASTQDGIRYESRTRACRNAVGAVLLIESRNNVKIVTGTFVAQMVSRAEASRRSLRIDNDIAVNVVRRMGTAQGKAIHMTGPYECNSTACVSQSGYLNALNVTNSWRRAEGVSKLDIPRGQKRDISETWRIRISVPGRANVTAWTVSTQPRCDNNYVSGLGQGCVYDEVRPIVTIPASGLTSEAGTHIRRAISSGLPSTLTRTDPSSRRANSKAACPASLPRPAGHQCDEYPFASSREGAAVGGTARVFSGCHLTTAIGAGPVGFSRCMILSTHNRRGGAIIARTYYTNRVLPGDKFSVRVG